MGSSENVVAKNKELILRPRDLEKRGDYSGMIRADRVHAKKKKEGLVG